MKISVNWLEQLVDFKLPPAQELAAKIGTQLGEVEQIVHLGKKYAGLKIVKVKSCKNHPNADKLKVCEIDTGKGTSQVVCGANNVREGMWAVWIPPGAVVPATFEKDPLEVEEREIRGKISAGMLASPHELAISDDHTGLLEVEVDAKPGNDFAKVYGLDDYVIEIENKSFTHRPDCFGLLGIAREVSGIFGKPFKSPDWYTHAPKLKSGEGLNLSVENKLPKLAPRFMAVAIKDVSIHPSTVLNQIYLAKVGIKPINNIVDLTNYLMYLTGQPMHAYDADKLKGGIVIRYPKKGEKLRVLGGKVAELKPDDIVIADAEKAIGLGGVIGGADTEVDANTANIILECANFDLYSVRKTSMQHGLFTDAVTRFSKGQNPAQTDRVLAQAMALLLSDNGTQASEVVDKHTKSAEHPPVHTDGKFITSRLGEQLDDSQITRLLENVEFGVEKAKDGLSVKPPFWRQDIHIPEDVVEEVGRLYGYDHLKLELPGREMSPARISDELHAKQTLRAKLSSLGANEAYNYSFIRGKLLEACKQDTQLAYKLKNALSPDLQYYRLSLTPSLLSNVHPNIKAGHDKFALFEFGKVHAKSEADDRGLPKEFGRIALVFAANAPGKGAPYYQAKAYLAQLLKGRFSDVRFIRPKDSKFGGHKLFSQLLAPFDLNRSAVIMSQGQPLGVVGEYNPKVAARLKLPELCAGFELFLSPFFGEPAVPYSPISRYPSTSQDICLRTKYALDFALIAESLDSSLQKYAPKDVATSCECIDIFARDKTHKQTTFRLTAVSHERTLTTEVVSLLLDKVAADLTKNLNWERV